MATTTALDPPVVSAGRATLTVTPSTWYARATLVESTFSVSPRA
jgi:hypothetical protein